MVRYSLEESSVANKILCLQLLQSLILEPITPALRHQAIEAISTNLLQQLASSTNNEVMYYVVCIHSLLVSLSPLS